MRQLLNVLTILVFGSLVGLSCPLSAESEPGNDSTDEESTAAPSSDDSPSFFGAPAGYSWALEAGYGSYSWRTAASSYEAQANLQLGALYRLSDVWAASARVDWSRRRIESGELLLDNQHWRLLGGFGVTHWINIIRLEAMAHGGALLKTARHSAATSDPVSAAAIRPTFGGSAALGIGFLERVALSLTGAFYWSPPARPSPVVGARLDVPFGFAK